MNKLALLAASALIATSAPLLAQTGGGTTGGTTGGEAGASGGVTGDTGTGAGTTGGTGPGVDSESGAGAEMGTGGTAGTDTGGTLGDTTASTGGGELRNYDAFMTSFDASGETASEIEGLDTVSSVEVVPVSELEGYDQAQFDDSLSRNEDDVASLRTAIESNSEIQSQLDSQMMDGQEIMAADVDPSGNVIVYTR